MFLLVGILSYSRDWVVRGTPVSEDSSGGEFTNYLNRGRGS